MAKKTVDRKGKTLDEVVKLLASSFGENKIGFYKDLEYEKVDRLGTGSLKLDEALNGGLPSGKIIEIYGLNGAGKAQPLSSNILTPSGWKKMGDIQVGDIVCCPNNKTSTILGVFPQGKKDVYEVIFDDKSSALCTADHLWGVYTRSSDLINILSTKDLIDGGLKNDSGLRKYKIPSSGLCFYDKYSSNDLPIDPYVFGLLLGDGHFSETSVRLSTSDDFIVKEIETYCDKYSQENEEGLQFKYVSGYDYSFSKTVRSGEFRQQKNHILSSLDSLGLRGLKSQDKFIPDVYLYNSAENRLALLQGLMDSNGYCPEEKMYTSFSTVSPALSEGFVDLCRGLGCRASTSSRITSYKSVSGEKVSGRPSYRTSVLVGADNPFYPFRLPRKKDRFNIECLSRFSDRFIESISIVGKDECQCIMVSDSDSLYITDNHVVTHNTTLTLEVIAQAQKDGKVVAFLDAEHALHAEYAKNLGVNMDEVIYGKLEYGEDCFESIIRIAHTGSVDLIVVDSVAALVPKKEINNAMGEELPALHARLMSAGIKKIVHPCSENGCTVIFINQLRKNLQGGWVATGGNTLPFYASMRLEVKRPYPCPIEEEDGWPVGEPRTVKVIKSKYSKPHLEIPILLRYDYGIDDISEILDIAIERGFIKKGGAGWFTVKPEDIKIQGKGKMRKYLVDNEEYFNDLKEKIINGEFFDMDQDKEEQPKVSD